MKLKGKMISAILIIAALISLFIPIRTLLTGDGVFAWQLRQQKSHEMLIEVTILILLLGAVLYFVKDGKKQMLAAAAVCTIFSWLHVTFLPMLISGLYAGYLLLLGRFVRRRLLGTEALCTFSRSACPKGAYCGVPEEYDFLADFLLGSSLVIAEFCLLSAFQIGGIPVLRCVSAVQAVLLYGRGAGTALAGIWAGTRSAEVAGAVDKTEPAHKTEPEKKADRAVTAALFTLIITAVLIQIGKMNITLDFDTLWYGVRSEYILDFGTGIYENPGLVGMTYVYSKGLETLVLPLADLASHSYLLFFNVWMAVLGLGCVYGIARFYMSRKYALLAAALAGAVPGIMNMSISAKPDIITWLLQLIMIYYLLRYIQRWEKKPAVYLILAAGAYLLSLTMKPTSLVFSTAVFGMAGLYLIFSRKVSFRAPVRHWLLLLPPAAALAGIWARTLLLTGMPVTSVFTSLFAKLGFQMKYPFATGGLPQNWQDESNAHVLARRLYQMLLAPEGKDMSHVVIAWGTSLLFFLLACILIFTVFGILKKRKMEPMTNFVHVVFWPFLIINLVSLVMLYQVDGNYFILLYTAVILFACRMFESLTDGGIRRLGLTLIIPILVLNILLSAESNWAWCMGFSDIRLLNNGRMNHRAMQRENMILSGNAGIWNRLAQDPQTRAIAFGEHPRSLEFPCNVQSYKDITAPWGNAELVNTAEAFERYMEYAKTDYVYAEAGFIGENSWSWSYGLLKEMIADGALTDLLFENGSMLARVSRGQPNETMAGSEITDTQAEENLRLFMENYQTAE